MPDAAARQDRLGAKAMEARVVEASLPPRRTRDEKKHSECVLALARRRFIQTWEGLPSCVRVFLGARDQ